MSFKCHFHLPQSKNVSMLDELQHVQYCQMSTFAEKTKLKKTVII